MPEEEFWPVHWVAKGEKGLREYSDRACAGCCAPLSHRDVSWAADGTQAGQEVTGSNPTADSGSIQHEFVLEVLEAGYVPGQSTWYVNSRLEEFVG